MIISMTGYGSSVKSIKDMDIEFNFKSVNNRFFDLNMKLPNYLFPIENVLQDITKQICVRGSIQVFSKIKLSSQVFELPIIDDVKLNDYYKSLLPINKKFKKTNFNLNFNVDQIINYCSDNNNNILSDSNTKIIVNTFKKGLIDLDKSRKIEGKKIGIDLKSNIKVLKRISKKLNSLQSKNKKQQFNLLKNRISKILDEKNFRTNEQNLYKELAIYSDKYDISEEVVRINCHLEQFDFILKNEKFPGKKVNFLCQELFREINTTGAKANNEKISFLVVDFKTSLEKIREQVQNIL